MKVEPTDLRRAAGELNTIPVPSAIFMLNNGIAQCQDAILRRQQGEALEWAQATDSLNQALLNAKLEEPVRAVERSGRLARTIADAFGRDVARGGIDVDNVARTAYGSLPFTFDVAKALSGDWRSLEVSTVRALRTTKRILAVIAMLDGIAENLDDFPLMDAWLELRGRLP